MERLSGLGQITSLARHALAKWGLPDQEPRLLNHRENTVFKIVLATGEPAALRVHRPGYHDLPSLLSELQWMAMLRERGISVPEPVASLNGNLVERVSNQASHTERHVDVLGWMRGAPLGKSGVALAFSPTRLERIFHELGIVMARMHVASDSWQRPEGFVRPAWDKEGLVGDKPFWGKFWQLPSMTAEQSALIQMARVRAAHDLNAYSAGGGGYGLIHADLVRENVFVSDTGVSLIDFDDCGFGWRVFDIATALYKNRYEPAYPAIEASLLAGYQTVRKFPAEELAALPLFTLLRSFTYIGWAQARLDEPGMAARLAKYIDDACLLSRSYLTDGKA